MYRQLINLKIKIMELQITQRTATDVYENEVVKSQKVASVAY